MDNTQEETTITDLGECAFDGFSAYSLLATDGCLPTRLVSRKIRAYQDDIWTENERMS